MTDSGGLTDTATITVGVTDVNEAPTAADASFTIAENAGTNAVVGSVTASDPDAGDTISYAITGGNADGAFAIDANGQITVANGSLLDHETAPSRTLTVTVTDAAGLTDTATVTVGVTDVNEAPTAADASFTIAENAGTNAVVGSVSASDPDAGDTISYAITGGNADGAFAIDANGQITVANGSLLDHETAPSRTLTVTVTDAAGLTDTATVTVGVTDVNEAPTAADASFTIAENAGTNAVVGSVTASDPDAGDTISYAITGGNADGAFAIDANGQITVANGSLLDHETAPSRTLTVTVTDAAGLTDTATVTIGVTDVNEAPTAADASFTIAENAGTNAVVGSVTASDPDAGDTISYSITGGNADGAFAIDANGQITVANGSLLDHETAPSRTLTVTVTDAAGLTDTATVTVGVTDVNEAPTAADASFTIAENAGTNAVVGSASPRPTRTRATPSPTPSPVRQRRRRVRDRCERPNHGRQRQPARPRVGAQPHSHRHRDGRRGAHRHGDGHNRRHRRQRGTDRRRRKLHHRGERRHQCGRWQCHRLRPGRRRHHLLRHHRRECRRRVCDRRQRPNHDRQRQPARP